MKLPVLLEIGGKKAFASAVEWPGWSRSGRDEQQALDALVSYGTRYKSAMGSAAAELTPPSGVAELEVAERFTGNASTDFGVPALGGKADERPIDDEALEHLRKMHAAALGAFERAAKAALGLELRKGPRGGGRDLDKIVAHVLEAEESYLTQIGARRVEARGATAAERMAAVRTAALEALAAASRGELSPSPRRKAPLWTPRYFVRRSAWHALDHAWEIEDRAIAVAR